MTKLGPFSAPVGTIERTAILAVIDRHWSVYGYAPSYRDIVNGLGKRRGLEWVQTSVDRMTERGLVVHVPASPRTIRLTNEGKAFLRKKTA